MTELEKKLNAFKLESQTKEKALENIKRLRKDLDLENIHPDRKRLRAILQKSGSLTDELLTMREQDRE